MEFDGIESIKFRDDAQVYRHDDEIWTNVTTGGTYNGMSVESIRVQYVENRPPTVYLNHGHFTTVLPDAHVAQFIMFSLEKRR